ncbi:cytochrome C [Mucilaginibacter sp. MD40]|uniref:cbb3-type cytochrome c oxidase N-terminal domain-containing protein n=1 Tax=Mucilaginibacter sp. MD40 TaxID=2029590 RepID=UPI000BAC564C|nr:cbb3-type cytochrome c oxidase N-terminal domain-containing protein [Mucilaginibacter sp. MD40]PAW94786.1 cytochrome C [Mucilaginibacter sp. MD40]
MKKLITLIALFMLSATAFAEDGGSSAADIKNYIGLGVILAMVALFLVVMLVLLRTFRTLARVILRDQGLTEAEIAKKMQPAKKAAKPKGEVWQKLLSLKPMSAEKDLLIPHDYDGIQELDNPTPAWFMWLFYVTIAFAVGYLLIYHVFGVGQLQYAEYKTEMAQAEIEKKIYLSKAANLVDENTVKLTTDQAALAQGKTVFKASCAPCHGENAQGMVGPNLTDEYWLHGGKINEVFKTIKYGVQAKGMPTWEKQLSPKQIADVANYVLSLQGSHPAGAKEPQGEKEAASKLASK